MRIPRKMKKKYKKLWEERSGRRLLIRKESISKEYQSSGRLAFGEESYSKVWGCEVYPLQNMY